MIIQNWQLNNPLDAIIFDCDGTLCSIEGIDELAKLNNIGEEVKALTHEAMEKIGLNPELYKQRLDLVHPSQKQVEHLGKLYVDNLTSLAYETIQVFNKLKKNVFILSAGLAPAVIQLGNYLNISTDHIFAVNIFFNPEGQFEDFDRDSPLVRNEGKRIFVSRIKERFARLGYVGDGLNDLSALDVVERFVGFGGNQYRENIAVRCKFYLQDNSFAPLLPLFLTLEETKNLTPSERNLYEYGLSMLECTQR